MTKQPFITKACTYSIAKRPVAGKKHGRLRAKRRNTYYGPETIVTVNVAVYVPAAVSAGTASAVAKVSVD